MLIANVVTTHSPPPTSGPLISLRVRMPDGGVLTPTATTGDRLIDALAAFGVPIRRGLQNCGAIGTDARHLYDLVVTPDLDGIELDLPWAVLDPQTSWVAG